MIRSQVRVLPFQLTIISIHVMIVLFKQILIMTFDVNNVVRSAALVVIGLPLTAGVSVAVLSNLPEGPTQATRVQREIKAALTRPCLDWAISKVDSKLEREAKNEIDDYFGGEVNHGEVCKFVL